MGDGLPSWSVEEAAAFIAEQVDAPASAEDVLADVKGAYRQAARRLHPDVGGNPELFRRLEHARRIVEAAQ
jgi:DnaJ-class molecular chaperone